MTGRLRRDEWSPPQSRHSGYAEGVRPMLIEFPADDPERARRFWSELLDEPVEERTGDQGRGWQTHLGTPAIGVHERGRGPGDTSSLPYFEVTDLAVTLE